MRKKKGWRKFNGKVKTSREIKRQRERWKVGESVIIDAN